MQYRNFIGVLFLLGLSGCTAFEDAEPTDRQSFVHFYSSATNYLGRVAEVDTDGGFILSGEVRHGNGQTDALVIKTDSRGHKVWEKLIPGGNVKGIALTENYYVVVGDSIKLNPESPRVHELVNTYARVMVLDRSGNTTARRITSRSVVQTESAEDVRLNVDYTADAVTISSNGDILVLGSFRIPGENAQSYLAAYNPENIADSVWQIAYVQLENDYVNCNSVHVTSSSHVVWASNIYSATQNLTRQHSAFPFINITSKSFDNASSFDGSDPRNHAVSDIRPSPTGFAALGTYAETNGESANIYFLRLNSDLSVDKNSVRYFDGQELMLNDAPLTKDTRMNSASQDAGLALATTDDGFVLACSMTSTPRVGNGGKDILLIKLDFFGNLIWKKILGGSGDEVVSSIRQTEDKGLLIFGTNTINGLSSMMLIKTDAHGNLDK